MQYDGETMSKQGISSGIEHGEVVDVGSRFHPGFVTDADRGGGDSGGPHFADAGWFSDDIMGVHGGKTPTGKSWATMISAVENRFNIAI